MAVDISFVRHCCLVNNQPLKKSKQLYTHVWAMAGLHSCHPSPDDALDSERHHLGPGLEANDGSCEVQRAAAALGEEMLVEEGIFASLQRTEGCARLTI